jgi:hypothetical protein
VRDQSWQEDYMSRLADFVIKAAENCYDVRTWLKDNPEYTPKEVVPARYFSDSD